MARATAPAVAGNASQQARRQRILDAAGALLADKPYEQIQIRDVAEAADVALGTLYRYFRSKEQLFAHVLLDWSRSFESRVRRQSAAAGTDAERVALALRRTVASYERFPHFFRLITVLEVVDDPEVAGPYREFSLGFRTVLADSLVDTEPEDAAVVCTLLLGQLSYLMRAWAVGQVSLREVQVQLDRAVAIVYGTPRARG